MSQTIVDTLLTGLPLVPAVVGIWMIFRLRADFDLTIDASFATGGAVTAALLSHGHGVAPTMAAAIAASGAMGLMTAGLHLLLRVPVLLAGVAMSIGFYSVDLRIMDTPSISLLDGDTLFSGFAGLTPDQADWATIAVLAAIVIALLAALGLFLRTELGLALRASGVNERMTRSQGADVRLLLCLSLVIANALAGLSGSLVVQSDGFADVNMGAGTLVAGIGAVLLGELLLRPTASRVARTMAALLAGALAYRLILVGALRLGLPATDLKAVTALTLVAAIAAERYGRPLFGLVRRRLAPLAAPLAPGATAKAGR
jgi:putative ABC transport system permease protein